MRALTFRQTLLSRSGRTSAVAAAAYDRGMMLTCKRTGHVYAYEGREDVVARGFVVPPGRENTAWARDPEALWNSVEAFEEAWAKRRWTRADADGKAWIEAHPDAVLDGEIPLSAGGFGKAQKAEAKRLVDERVRPGFAGASLAVAWTVERGEDGDVVRWRALPYSDHHAATAQTALRLIVALPRELDERQQQELIESFGRERFARYGYVVDWAIHRTPMNPHAHVRVTRRPLLANGTWGDVKNQGAVTPEGLNASREAITRMANSALAAAGHETRFDWRFYYEAGLAREDGPTLRPTRHEGRHAREVVASLPAGAPPESLPAVVRHNREVRRLNAADVLAAPRLVIDDLLRARATSICACI
jgi:hypothetical protein